MSNLQSKLHEIIAKRGERNLAIAGDIAKWEAYQRDIDQAMLIVAKAERVNPEIAGSEARLRSVADRIDRILGAYRAARNRFARNTLCIGVGGAARMGKSTFLQSVTGLGDTQLPTSDKYFTTATRSQIENSPNESIAIVDFYDEASFLSKVIWPMCDAIGISRPSTIGAFRMAALQLSPERRNSQGSGDVLQRLRDAQSELPTYQRYLTGERGRRVALEELRPFVAYPEPKDGRIVTAGPFLAVADLVTRATFPSTDVAQLRVVDLPGLGEAGRNLAKVQTEGMSDVCDITVMVKRPTDANIAWTDTDTNALDAMGDAVPLLEDQTKYTAILANVGSEDPERARLCVAAIRNKLDRPFEIIECDARNRESVTHETMPRILDFLAKNLPVIDGSIMTRLANDATQTLISIRNELLEVLNAIRKVAPAGHSEIDFAEDLFNHVVGVLTEQERIAEDRANGSDREWDAEVGNTHDAVIKWIKEGCGYGSNEALLAAICDEIKRDRAQPSHVINQCRVKFRGEWERMDLHLTNRIARLLSGAMDSLQGVMHSLVPTRAVNVPEIDAVRAQILEFAKRIDSRTTDLGDDTALAELSRPLRRIAEFDLQFRFHLEPMLHAMTHLLVANELPLVKDYNDAEMFKDAMVKKLIEAADSYAAGMRKSGAGSTSAVDRKKKLVEMSVTDPAIRKDLVQLLEQSVGSAQSFCPNRIFAAVMETFADAFIRSQYSHKAFQILAREWKNELMPAPDEKTRLTNKAVGVMADLVKKI